VLSGQLVHRTGTPMPIAAFFRNHFKGDLTESGPPPTFVRLLTSYHLEELQSIAFWTASLGGIILIWFVVVLVLYFFGKSGMSGEEWKIVGGAIALGGAVLSWTYQTGSKRLGVIDLFACEIGAICRMSLIADSAESQVRVALQEIANDSEAGSPAQFTSVENYTPVYDGNLSDLQPLNVNVISHVTEFYSYRKAMMDYRRRIAVEPDAQKKRGERDMMIYMQFLMYESARYAIEELIEFEPNLEESKINILCSEIVVFHYLTKRFPEGDYRGRRLRIRDYGPLIVKTLDRINKGHGSNWTRAKTTAKELDRRARRYHFISEASR
jgi:hypothetical protein